MSGANSPAVASADGPSYAARVQKPASASASASRSAASQLSSTMRTRRPEATVEGNARRPGYTPSNRLTA